MRISKTSPNHHKTGVSTQSNQNKPYRASFKGAGIVGLMDSIERGGLFASFTIQDMLGTNIPRPVMGLMRNKKENKGKSNKTFALKEAIREFTTGPSMFIIPGVLIAGAKKAIGKSINIPAQQIKQLNDIFKDTVNESNLSASNKLKDDYYTNVFKKILANSTGKEEAIFEEDAKELAKKLSSLGEKAKRNPIEKMFNKNYEGSIDEAIDSMAEKFINISKNHAQDVSIDFTTAKIAKESGSASFTKLISYISDFTDDAVSTITKENHTISKNTLKENVSKVMDAFANNRIVNRFGLNIIMSAAVVSFLAFIPKLYNISKDNPALRGLEPETKVAKAEPTEQTKKGEAANASK